MVRNDKNLQEKIEFGVDYCWGLKFSFFFSTLSALLSSLDTIKFFFNSHSIKTLIHTSEVGRSCYSRFFDAKT